jgi:hypothetical protein
LRELFQTINAPTKHHQVTRNQSFNKVHVLNVGHSNSHKHQVKEERARWNEESAWWNEERVRWKEERAEWKEDKARWKEERAEWKEDKARWKEERAEWKEEVKRVKRQ